MKLLLHPGHAKCGSSSIQGWIRQNLQQLQSAGIVVPSPSFSTKHDGRRPLINTYRYFLNLTEKDQIDEFHSQLSTFLSKAQRLGDAVLLSEEFLTDVRAFRPQTSIHTILGDAFESVSVLYYIRRQDDFILSGWQQWRHKLGKSFQQDVADSLATHQPDYLANIRHLEAYYGKSNLTVRPFDTEVFRAGSLIRDFCQFMGLDYDAYDPLGDRENVSLNPYLCEVLSLSSDSLYQNNHDNNEILKWFQKFGRSSLAFEPLKEYMKSELRTQVMRHFDVENRKIHSEYFPELDFESLFGIQELGKTFDETEALKKLLSLQFELLFNISKSSVDEKTNKQTFLNRLKSIFVARQ